MRPFASFFLALVLTFFHPCGAAAKSSKKKKGEAADPKAPKFDVPIPVGHAAEGVTLPYFDDQGKLQMNYKIDSATRVDLGHLKMTHTLIETYDDAEKVEMKIDMPTSTLDLNTKVVTSETPVTISRSDFQITGERMRFDTDSRAGVMFGKVRMVIYNQNETFSDKTK